MTAFAGGADSVRQANAEGAFALGTTDIRAGRFMHPDVEASGGVFTVRLWDLDTNELLASTPWPVCGSLRENQWCVAALNTALVE